MKILCVPDVHGTKFWKQAQERIDEFDKIIILGDLVDSWTNKQPDQKYNLAKIISFKRNNSDKVDLLWGNHDISYYLDERCSGYQYEQSFDYYDIYNINKHLFQAVAIYKNYIFSHAGVSQWWLNRTGVKSVNEINQLFLEHPNYFRFVGPESSGDNVFEGPFWVRPNSLRQVAVESYNQIIGHSECHNPPETFETYNGDKITIIDSPKHNYLHEIEI